MGLGFATFFDPQQSGQVQLVGRFYGLLATLTFLAIDGHLQVIAILAHSFTTLPIGAEGMSTTSFTALVNWGIKIFMLGLHLSLPVLTALLITNLALGILTRAAPQLNILPSVSTDAGNRSAGHVMGIALFHPSAQSTVSGEFLGHAFTLQQSQRGWNTLKMSRNGHSRSDLIEHFGILWINRIFTLFGRSQSSGD